MTLCEFITGIAKDTQIQTIDLPLIAADGKEVVSYELHLLTHPDTKKPYGVRVVLNTKATE